MGKAGKCAAGVAERSCRRGSFPGTGARHADICTYRNIYNENIGMITAILKG